MNGARTIYMRGGWLLTALAAVVLLVASPGTAAAQITVTGPTSVEEGGTVTYDVLVQGYLAAATAGGTLTVQVALTPAADASGHPTAGETEDLNLVGNSFTATVPTNEAGTTPVPFMARSTIQVQTLHDADAEDERFTLAFTASGVTLQVSATNAATIAPAATNPRALVIDDDEDQTFTWTRTAPAPPAAATEAAPVTVQLAAVPTFVNRTHTVQFILKGPAGVFQLPATSTATLSTTAAEIIVTPNNPDGNRTNDDFTLEAWTGTAGNDMLLTTSPSFTVVDSHLLPDGDEAIKGAARIGTNTVTELTEGGDAATLTVTVSRGTTAAPVTTEDLTVSVVAADPAQAGDFRVTPATQTLTGGAVGTPQTTTFTISAVADDDVDLDPEMPEELVLNLVVKGTSANGPGEGSGKFSIDIKDATTALVWPLPENEAYPKITEAIDDGEASELDDGKLNPEPQESFTIDASGLFGRAQGYTATYVASSDNAAATVNQAGAMVTVTAQHEGTAKVTITATAEKAAGSSFMPDQTKADRASITFAVNVEDSDLAVEVVADPAAIDEGGTSEITATANRMVTAADGEVAIDLLVVGDATLDSESIMIAAGEMSGSAMLTAGEDEDTNDSTVTVVASGSGIADTMQVEIAVNDTTEGPEPTNVITPKAQDEAYPIITGAIEGAAGDAGLNPGESFSVTAGDLFDVMEGYSASYSADADSDAVSVSVSGSEVSVTAAMAGEAKVTVTGTATMSASLEGGQSATNVATQTFPVTVVDKALTLTLDAPGAMDGNVVEGMDYDITVTANRAVLADTEVSFMRSDMSEADVRDYSIDGVTIMAGETMATATLMVTEDMMDDAGHAMGEALHLYAMAGDAMSNTLELTIWDEAVPALPLIGQLVLALFLALGGARLYRRRQG